MQCLVSLVRVDHTIVSLHRCTRLGGLGCRPTPNKLVVVGISYIQINRIIMYQILPIKIDITWLAYSGVVRKFFIPQP